MDFNIKVYIYDFNLKRQVTMNEFESIGLVTELTGSPNIQYVINDDSTFALTDFKVLKGQGSNLVQCAKVRYNGKIKLIYFTSEKKSLKNIVQALDSDSFITVIANLISSVNDIKSNGFLELSNLALTFDKIFVDSNTLSVSLIYLPINNSHSDTVQTENELRTEIIKVISSVPTFATEKMNRISSYLWTPENPTNKYTRLNTVNTPGYNIYEKSSFIRLQDLSIAYNIPENILKNLKVGHCKVYLSGRNLLTFTKWSGWDPESGNTPMPRIFTFGIDVTL